MTEQRKAKPAPEPAREPAPVLFLVVAGDGGISAFVDAEGAAVALAESAGSVVAALPIVRDHRPPRKEQE